MMTQPIDITGPSQSFSIRFATPSDIPFIYETWLKSYRCDSTVTKHVKKSVYFNEYKQVIDGILAQSEVNTLIACDPSAPGVIYGYIVGTTDIVHYCFVKDAFRRLGLGKKLFLVLTNQSKCEGLQRDRIVSISHLTSQVNAFLCKTHAIIYNPYLLFQK